MWSFSDRETYRRLKEIPWNKMCNCYSIEENTADSIDYCCWKEVLWNKLCHHCQRDEDIFCVTLWVKAIIKKTYNRLRSFFHCISLFKENSCDSSEVLTFCSKWHLWKRCRLIVVVAFYNYILWFIIEGILWVPWFW